MAQSGYTPILIYASSTPGALPSAANLTSSASGAELAINYADGKLYFKNSSGVVTLLAGSSSGPAGGSNTQVQYNSSGVLAGSSNMTFNGTKLTVAGFLDSALTSGRVPYATTSGELIDSANLLYSGTDLTVYGITVGRGAGGIASNTAVGYSALGANTSGSLNTAVGYQAGAANTTAAGLTLLGYQTGLAATAGNITAVGYQALLANTTGLYNTAIGQLALQANTTASNNTAVGYQAGYTNSTGTGLATFGYQAGYSTTADYNNFFGYRAGYTNTTGTANNAVGTSTLYYNTTGSYNTAIGNNALQANTTASNNTAVGYQAGYSNTTGTANTYLGEGAGFSNTTSSYNTFIGEAAGRSFNTSGNSGNTFVGVGAGYGTTTGTANTFVGAWNPATTVGCGQLVTTGSKNTILGGYNGNQGGLDIRTASNYIVLSDGDGNPLVSTYANGTVALQGAVPNNGTGITFPATQSASSNANTLDDYERGTWTPTDASGAGLSFTTVAGEYTKIGRQVIAYFNVTFPSTASSAQITIGGLPYTSAGSASVSNPGGGGFTYQTASISNVTFAIGASSSSFNMWTLAGAAIANASASTFILRGYFTYIV